MQFGSAPPDWMNFELTHEEIQALLESKYVMRVGLLGSILTYELYSIRADGKPLVCPLGHPRSYSTICVSWGEVVPVNWIEQQLNRQEEIRARFEAVDADIPF